MLSGSAWVVLGQLGLPVAPVQLKLSVSNNGCFDRVQVVSLLDLHSMACATSSMCTPLLALPQQAPRAPAAQVKKDFAEIVLAARQDPFYARHMYAIFGDSTIGAA